VSEKPVVREMTAEEVARKYPCTIPPGHHPHTVAILGGREWGTWPCDGDGNLLADEAPAPVKPRLRFRVFFAWYDGWLGYYWDRRERVLYVCLIPTIVMEFRRA
jgi:hypothetical protein